MAAQNTQFSPDRDKDAVVYAVFDGLRNDVSPERFELGDLAVADNVNIDKSGRLTRRGGSTLIAGGARHSLWADELQEVCLLVTGGQLHRVNPDLSSTAVAALADGLSPVSYTRVSDRVYFANGRDTGIFEAGAVRSWGMPVAPLPSAAAAFGQMSAGTYQFAMTWLRTDGQESGCMQAGQITLGAGGGITFSTPAAAPAGVVAALLYVSPANSDVLLFAGQVVPGGSLLWQRDPSELSLPLATQSLSPPPAGHLVAYYRGHLFVAVGDTIFMSQPYAYELFDLRRYLQLDGRITLLAPFMDKERSIASGDASGFFIGTDRSMGVMSGTDPDNFQYVPKVDYGAVQGTLQYVDGSLVRDGGAGARKLPMWLSAKGVCIGLPDLLINNLTRSRFSFDAGGQGAAIFMPNPNRFIATSNL